MDVFSDGPTIRLVGPFDGRSTALVREVLHGAIREGARSGRDVVVDLDEVDATDLAALRMLAASTRVARRAGIHVLLRGAQPAVRRLLHLAHLRHLVEVEPSRRPEPRVLRQEQAPAQKSATDGEGGDGAPRHRPRAPVQAGPHDVRCPARDTVHNALPGPATGP